MSILRKSVDFIFFKAFKFPNAIVLRLNGYYRIPASNFSSKKYIPLLNGITNYLHLYNTKFNGVTSEIKFACRPNHLKKCFTTGRANTYPNNENHNTSGQSSSKKWSSFFYALSIGVLVAGMSYAAVPLYRIFCQANSFYGTTIQDELNSEKIQTMRKIEDIHITIKFNADTAASMRWNFKPQQPIINVVPGETALAFYSARNPTDKSVIGISTYNVIPFDAGQYFNKIQCFCFEEQILNPNEEVSMPVFFYIDPEFADDPKMESVDEITLSYTFFEVKDGVNIPLPGFMTRE